MYHPLVADLSNMKETEIEQKITELTKRYYAASSAELQRQVIILLDTYKQELETRRYNEWAKMAADQEKMVDKLINVD